MAVSDALGRRRGTIIVLALLSITLLTLDLRGNSVINGARRVALDVTAPIRAVGRTVATPFQNVWHGIVDYPDVKAENERLRDQVEQQQGASIAAEAQVREYQDLLSLNKLPAVAGIPSVMAQVISQPASNFELTVEISQGAASGVRVGMPVVNSAGLVGRVTQVTDRRSVVRLITDPELNVAVKISGAASAPPPTALPPATTAPATTAPATSGAPAVADPTATTPPAATTAPPTAAPPTTVPPPTAPGATAPPDANPPPPAALSPTPSTLAPGATTTVPTGPLATRELGILHGEGRGRPLTVDFVDVDTQIVVGDPVVTSGVDQSLSPGDIPVGRVSAVKRVPGSFQLGVQVEPVAALDELTFVKVLLYVPEF